MYDARLLDVQDQQSRFVRTSDLFRNAERLTCWGEPSVAQAIALIMIPFVLQGGLDGIFCAVIDCLIRTSCTIALAGRERSPALPVSGNVVSLCDRYASTSCWFAAGTEWMGNLDCWRSASNRSSGRPLVQTAQMSTGDDRPCNRGRSALMGDDRYRHRGPDPAGRLRPLT